jgi:hypothetical protein
MNENGDMAREAKETYKIQAWSWPEVQDGLEGAATRLKGHTRDIGRALKPGPLLNAIILWFLKQPEQEQIRIARQGKMGLEWLKTSDEPRNLNDLNIDEFDRRVTSDARQTGKEERRPRRKGIA